MIPFLNTASGTNISAGIQESVELIRKFAEKDGVRVPPSQFGHEAMKSSRHTLQEDSHHLLVLLSRET